MARELGVRNRCGAVGGGEGGEGWGGREQGLRERSGCMGWRGPHWRAAPASASLQCFGCPDSPPLPPSTPSLPPKPSLPNSLHLHPHAHPHASPRLPTAHTPRGGFFDGDDDFCQALVDGGCVKALQLELARDVEGAQFVQALEEALAPRMRLMGGALAPAAAVGCGLRAARAGQGVQLGAWPGWGSLVEGGRRGSGRTWCARAPIAPHPAAPLLRRWSLQTRLRWRPSRRCLWTRSWPRGPTWC